MAQVRRFAAALQFLVKEQHGTCPVVSVAFAHGQFLFRAVAVEGFLQTMGPPDSIDPALLQLEMDRAAGAAEAESKVPLPRPARAALPGAHARCRCACVPSG